MGIFSIIQNNSKSFITNLNKVPKLLVIIFKDNKTKEEVKVKAVSLDQLLMIINLLMRLYWI